MRGWLVGAVPVVVSALAFLPITRSYFFSDDFVALYALANGTGEDWLVRPTGGHLLFLRNLAYVVTWTLAGPDPRPFMWSALATHVALVALLFAIVKRASGHVLTAALVATWWGTCRTDAGTLEWYAVYGQAMATLVLAVALASMIAHERRGTPVGAGHAAAWGALLLAGSTCFGTGVAVAVLYPGIVALVFPRERVSRRAWTIALAVPPLMVALYAGVHLTSQAAQDAIGPSAKLADLLHDLPLVARFSANLFAAGAASLVLGPLWDRTHYPDATTMLAATLVTVALAAGTITATPRMRRLVAAMLLVAGGAYAIVAVGRAGLYELQGARHGQDPISFGASTARYHYLAQFALAAALGLALGAVLDWRPVPRRLALAVGATLLAAVSLGTWLRPPPLELHLTARRGAAALQAEIRKQAREAHGPAVHLPNRPWGAGGPLLGVNPRSFPGVAGAFVVYFPDDVVEGRQVRFVGSETDVAAARATGGRIATLLVAAP